MAVDPREWKPWGFDDYESVREITEQAFQAALKHLNVADEARKTDLRQRFKGVATSYWRARRNVERPPPNWYYRHIESVKKATDHLLKVLAKIPKGRGQTPLIYLTELRMKRRLRGESFSEPEPIEQILQRFSRVCAECIAPKQSAGARPQSHVQNAVQELAAIWEEVDGRPLSVSLDTAKGHRGKEFTYPGPRFIQIVLQGIDPDLSTSKITTALRKALGGRRAHKSAKC